MSWLLGIIGRFLPGLGPAVGALANPWILLAIGAALAGAFLYGLHIGHERLEAYEMKVAAVGFAQEQRTQEHIRRGKILKEQTDAEYNATLGRLSSQLAAAVGELSINSGRSFLPSTGSGADGTARITIIGSDLDRALRDFDAEIRTIHREAAFLVGEGDRAIAGLDTARRWNAEREREQ